MSLKGDLHPASRLPLRARKLAVRVFAMPLTQALIGGVILVIDSLSGPFVLFPNIFALPVALAAWLSSSRWAYTLAVVLPVARFFVAGMAPGSSLLYNFVNAATRVAVLLFLAFLIARIATQSKAYKERLGEFVTMCAWSRTIEYRGEWMSFEQYLEKRFGIRTSHTISPAESERVLADFDQENRHLSESAAPDSRQDQSEVA